MQGIMSNVIYVDFASGVAAQDAGPPGAAPARLATGAVAAPQAQALARSMSATASLGQLVVRLRTGADATELALQQMRDGSAELIRVSAEMRQQTGTLAGQIGTVSTALDAFDQAVLRMNDARSAPTIH
jgi:hypothetical protein